MALRVASPALARGSRGPSAGRRLARGARRVTRPLVDLTSPVAALRPSRSPLTVRVGPPPVTRSGGLSEVRSWRVAGATGGRGRAPPGLSHDTHL